METNIGEKWQGAWWEPSGAELARCKSPFWRSLSIQVCVFTSPFFSTFRRRPKKKNSCRNQLASFPPSPFCREGPFTDHISWAWLLFWTWQPWLYWQTGNFFCNIAMQKGGVFHIRCICDTKHELLSLRNQFFRNSRGETVVPFLQMALEWHFLQILFALGSTFDIDKAFLKEKAWALLSTALL